MSFDEERLGPDERDMKRLTYDCWHNWKLGPAIPLALMTVTICYVSGVYRSGEHGGVWARDLARVVGNSDPRWQHKRSNLVARFDIYMPSLVLTLTLLCASSHYLRPLFLAPQIDLRENSVWMERSPSAQVGARTSSISLAGPRMTSLEPSEPSDAENEELPPVVNTPWPGSDFKVGNILPDSVYLWACGESFGGDTLARVSRSQAAAAWIILTTQAVCYAGLWYASGNQPDQHILENERSSETTGGYSILAITGAMYLILSIAAADVWCGCALIVEGRDSVFVLFTRRRLFGVLLLATFLTLVGASIRVLFYSANEDVQLVIGAAAVLFITDVDEKAMSVLKNISGEWVLFWVIEFVGLSFGLAVFAVKVTGNTDAIGTRDEEHPCTTGSESGCDIFTWGDVIAIQPTAVTALAFVLTSIVLRTTSSFAGRLFFPRSWSWFVITLFMLAWVAQAPLWAFHLDASIWFNSCSAGCALVFTIVWYRRELTFANLSNKWRKGLPKGGRHLLYSAGLLFSVRLIMVVAFGSTSSEASEGRGVFVTTFFDFYHIFDVLFAALYLITYLWLINGLRSANSRFSALESNVALVPFLRPMLLGWWMSEGLFAIHYWTFLHAPNLEELYPNSSPWIFLAEHVAWLTRHVIVGTCLWVEEAGERGVGYWTAATFIRTIVAHGLSTWIAAWLGKTVK